MAQSHALMVRRESARISPRLVFDDAAADRVSARRVLIVEDQVNLANLVRIRLEQEGFDVTVTRDWQHGYPQAAAGMFDLVVLDVSLPALDEVNVCATLRAKGIASRILMLSARYAEPDRVAGLDAGADDYVSKPFGVSELMARVRALMRRLDRGSGDNAGCGAVVTYRDIRIEEATRRVTVAGALVTLTATEFDLLWVLARSHGRAFTRSQLLDLVWHHDYTGLDNTVKSHVNRLRSKIEPDPSRPAYVLTVWGVGYQFGSDQDL